MIKEKIGRNDPCPCKSGKKYKNCCMEKDQVKLTGLKGRKFTAKVISAKGTPKQPEQVNPEHIKPLSDYNTLMKRSFGEAVKKNQGISPPVPSSPSKYLVQNEEVTDA